MKVSQNPFNLLKTGEGGLHDGVRPSRESPQDAVERVTYKPEEASALLGIGRTGVYELLRSGRLRGIRIGRKIIIPASALQEFLDHAPGPK